MKLLDAMEAALPGWNLRCNLCGEHPAEWLLGERPGWGALALCAEHLAELREEQRRHREAMSRLRTINFEQLPVREIEMAQQARRRRARLAVWSKA